MAERFDVFSAPVERALRELAEAYELTDERLHELAKSWATAQGTDAEFLAEVDRILAGLTGAQDRFVRTAVLRAVADSWAVADQRVGQDLPARISRIVAARIQTRVSRVLAQQPETVRREIQQIMDEGYRRGMSVADRSKLMRVIEDRGITGYVRTDGSRLSLRATGKAIARTRMNQLTVEAQIERYQRHGITQVEFRVGGECRYRGEGGSCTSLNGRIWPIDEIPDWARPPRHLYGNSTLLPVAPA